jgi:phosphoglucosamine mutase
MVATTRYELRGLCACAVGDRQVLDRMHADGFNLGGERSGHIIMTDHATTGDGLMAALPALSVLIRSHNPANETFRAFEPVPQLLKAGRMPGDGKPVLKSTLLVSAIAAAQGRLGQGGRALVRRSSVEPPIGVLAEGDDPCLVRDVIEEIIEALPAFAGR